jgi:hypothetical protein
MSIGRNWLAPTIDWYATGWALRKSYRGAMRKSFPHLMISVSRAKTVNP